ncbi:MAG: hypothetical protein WAM89_08465 [Terriglobales bacterium]
MKRRYFAAILVLLVILLSSACDSGRLTQFSTLATAGSLYVQNLHKVIQEAGSAMIASDSAVLVAAGKIAGKDVVSSHKDQYTNNIQTNDAELQQYLATLQIIDAHATLLGSYFDALAKLANSKADAKTSAAAGVLDSLSAVNPKVENATLKAANSSTSVKQFVPSGNPLVVAHFEVKAIDEQLKKDAPTIDQALALQEAAVTAIVTQMKDSLAVSLQGRELSDVISPYLENVDKLPSDWSANREAFLRAKVAIDSVDSARAAIAQLHKDFRRIVEDRNATIDFTTLLNDINKMSGYESALQSTAKPK